MTDQKPSVLAPCNQRLPLYDQGNHEPGSPAWARRQASSEDVRLLLAEDQALRAALRNCGLVEHSVDDVASAVWRLVGAGR